MINLFIFFFFLSQVITTPWMREGEAEGVVEEEGGEEEEGRVEERVGEKGGVRGEGRESNIISPTLEEVCMFVCAYVDNADVLQLIGILYLKFCFLVTERYV